jgi:type II secretory pathway pseudopilin PulG
MARLRLNNRGYTLAGALALLAVMAILMTMAITLWSRVKQRDNEEELIFRGNQYVKAIARYHQKFGSYPPDLETLEKLKFIRQLYSDPMTKSGKWKVLNPQALVQTGAAGTINNPSDNNRDNRRNQNGDDTGEDDRDHDGDNSGSMGDNNNGNSSEDGDSSSMGDDEEDKSDEEEEVEAVGPIVGVASRSKKASMKIFNGQSYYNKWVFVYALAQQQQRPGQPGGNPNTGPGQQPGGLQPGLNPGQPNTNPRPPGLGPGPGQQNNNGNNSSGNDDDDDNDNWEKE